MRKGNNSSSNASVDALDDIFGKLTVAPKQANTEATGMNQQELLEAIGACIEEIIDDQRYRFQRWLEEHKAEEGMRYMVIEPQIRTCATLLEAMLEHMRNPCGGRQVTAGDAGVVDGDVRL